MLFHQVVSAAFFDVESSMFGSRQLADERETPDRRQLGLSVEAGRWEEVGWLASRRQPRMRRMRREKRGRVMVSFIPLEALWKVVSIATPAKDEEDKEGEDKEGEDGRVK